MRSVTNIDLSKVKGVNKYAGQYVAISADNDVLGSGPTYAEAVRSVTDRDDVAVFSIPEADIGLAPTGL